MFARPKFRHRAYAIPCPILAQISSRRLTKDLAKLAVSPHLDGAPAQRKLHRSRQPGMALASLAEQPSTSGGAGDERPLGSKFAGLQPSKIIEAVTALLQYVGANTAAEKVLFQEDEILHLVSVFDVWKMIHDPWERMPHVGVASMSHALYQ